MNTSQPCRWTGRQKGRFNTVSVYRVVVKVLRVPQIAGVGIPRVFGVDRCRHLR